MKKLSYFLMLLAGCSVMFTACIDNDESDSIKQLRDAKAKETEAMAAYYNAQAQAALIMAQADAEYLAAQAQVEAAKATYILAKAAYEEAQALIKQLEAEILQGTVSAEIEAALAAAKAKAAEHAAAMQEQENRLAQAKHDLELLNIKFEHELEAAQLTYQAALLELKAYIADLVLGSNSTVTTLLGEYVTVMNKIATKELAILNKSLTIKKKEAEYVFDERTDEVDAEQFLKEIKFAALSAQQALDAEQTKLDMWKTLEADVERVEALIAQDKKEIEQLKKDRIDTYNARNEAEELVQPAWEEYRTLRFRTFGFDYYYTPNSYGTQDYYTSSVRNDTYQMGNVVEGIRAIIPIAEEDLAYAQQIADDAVAAYEAAVAGNEAAVAANESAAKALNYATEMWWAAYYDLNTSTGEGRTEFLAADKSYCNAYTVYYGGTPDGSAQRRPNSSWGTQLVFSGVVAYDGNTYTANAGVQNSYDAAHAAWLAAKAEYDASEYGAATALLAIDAQYCDLFRQLYGGTVDGNEVRPDGNPSLFVTEFTEYTGVQYMDGTLSAVQNIDNLRIMMNTALENVLCLELTVASMYEVEEAFGEVDEAYDNYVALWNDYAEKDNEWELVKQAILDAEQLIRDLEMIQTVIAYGDADGNAHGAAYDIAIQDIKDTIKDLEENIEGYVDENTGDYVKGLKDKLADAQFDLENYEEKYLAEVLSVNDMLEYKAQQIEELKTQLAALEYELAGLKALAANLKAAIDELL